MRSERIEEVHFNLEMLTNVVNRILSDGRAGEAKMARLDLSDFKRQKKVFQSNKEVKSFLTSLD